MKALIYIMILTAVILSSCATGLYVGGGYDDLYYSPSDEPVRVQNTVHEQIAAGNLNSEQYYDNIYAKDTLIADEYNDAVDFDNSMFYNNDNSAFEYMDDFSYSNRLRRFYGNYFDPFWRDPFYYGYPSYGYGYGYDPFWSSRMYDPYGYGGFYGGFSGGYYGGYYGSMFSPYSYGNWGYNPGFNYYNSDNVGLPVSRRATYSTLSNNYNSASPSRKSTLQSGTGGVVESRRTEPALAGQSPDRRNPATVSGTSRQAASTLPENRYGQPGVQSRRDIPGSSGQVSTSARPDYKSADRTYTPSYNNPRMSTRPSYNNTRTQSGSNTNAIVNPGNSRIGNSNYNTRSNSGIINSGRSSSTISPTQNRSIVSGSGRSESYSVPTRRDMSSGSGSSVQRSNFNSSSGSSGSSGSGRSSSVSSGSSSSGSSSSSSSGSSSSRRK
jgi:hypothetical protein